jgi:enoyl-CoA hydratase/carnithine racemase
MTSAQATDSTARTAVSLEIREAVAVICIDLPGKPLNVLSALVIEEFSAIITKLEQDLAGARAAAIVSGKPGAWIAGADVEQLRLIDTAEQG